MIEAQDVGPGVGPAAAVGIEDHVADRLVAHPGQQPGVEHGIGVGIGLLLDRVGDPHPDPEHGVDRGSGSGRGRVLDPEVDREVLGEPGVVVVVAQRRHPVPVGRKRARVGVRHRLGRRVGQAGTVDLERQQLAEDLPISLGGNDGPVTGRAPVPDPLDPVLDRGAGRSGAQEVGVEGVGGSTRLDRGGGSHQGLGQELAAVDLTVPVRRRLSDETVLARASNRLDAEQSDQFVDVHGPTLRTR